MSAFAFQTTWGANVGMHGKAKFRLWAPAQAHLSLCATRTARVLPMHAAEQGWFELETDAVGVGDGYSFQLSDGRRVPDPASRGQIDGIHGPSRLVDGRSYDWKCGHWRGRPWEEAVIYELHTGTFTPHGTFDGVLANLDHLARLGITAIEIMPVGQFGGRRGWGYDGVLLYAPHTVYGGAEGLKRLVDAAHERQLMVLLDVVYNHFGPDGNYLHLYAPQFFQPDRTTPWGAAIAYDKAPVRAYFIENALYWLLEYQLDGLRLDAINQIQDPSEVSLLEELAQRVRQTVTGRHAHLTTEDDRNIVRLHERDDGGEPQLFTAEWNDDVHHACHVIATGETDGYYQDYCGPAPKLARALAEGFVYQGESSSFWSGAPRGEPSQHLPPTAFIDFLQNHDQVGNRAFGERLVTLAPERTIELLTSILLLSPHIPLLFMGEEWGEQRPFRFFTDFDGELAERVRNGRRNEFKKWPAFQGPQRRQRIPDPNAETTFACCVLDWAVASHGNHARRLQLVRTLLGLRAREIVPRLRTMRAGGHLHQTIGQQALWVIWNMGSVSLELFANFANTAASLSTLAGDKRAHRILYASAPPVIDRAGRGEIAEASVLFRFNEVGVS